MRSVTRGGAAAVIAALAAGSWTVAAEAQEATETPLAPQLAYAYGENETARSLAMGGAVRALGNGTTAVYLNPANMALSRVYRIEAFGQLTPEITRVLGGATIVDSITSSTRIAGALSVVGGMVDPVDAPAVDGKADPVNPPDRRGLGRTLIDIRTGVAYPIGDRFFVGLGGRYLRMTQRGEGPLGPSKVSGGLSDSAIVDNFTFDAGITVRLSEKLHIGLVGQNLTHPGHGLLPTTFGGGIGYGSKDFSIEADAVADFDAWGRTTVRAMAGGEYLAGDHYPLRAGYRFDEGPRVHMLSAGVGYIGKEFAIELSSRRTLSGSVNATMFVLSLTYHLEQRLLSKGQVAAEAE
jgi:hypothetical protein